MPDLRADSVVARRSWLSALVTSLTLVSGVAVLRSTVERLHTRVSEVRRFRERLAERRRKIDRQSQELTAIGSRAMEVHEVLSTPRTMRAIATLAEARSVPTLWPVRGAVSSPFGWRRSPYGGEREWHRGIDITAPYGTPIHATADGEVVLAGRARGYGALVVVDHGGATTRYAHLSAIWVRAGQQLCRGEPVGALGRTGRATAPHLHYEVRIGSEPLDPECLLMPGASRHPSRACAPARARLEDRRSPTARDADRVTTPRAGVAG